MYIASSRLFTSV